MMVIGEKVKLDFPEDFASEESYEHFWDRMVGLVAEWLNRDIEIRDIDELENLIPDYKDFMHWLNIFDQDVHDFIKFHEHIKKGVK